ncbi:MAG: hypothetical protein KF799_06255 [Bdellovibrionales bacterium]|nr:hypothetical protein [Bdellovibrionales bacterium]
MGFFLVILALFGAAAPVEAAVIREDIGELKIHDLLLRPNFTYRERREGAFSIGESSFALRWELEEKFSSVIRIGPRTLLNPVARYQPTVAEDVTLVEAYAEYNDPYGRFRLGRVPVEFGYEGRQWERNLIFPRSFLFEKRIMMLRDVGFSYEVSHNQWYTGFVVHNGESDTDVDGQIWYTARWGFRKENFELGFAGQTGETKPTSTGTSGDTLAGIDTSRDAKWRMGGIYNAYTERQWEFVLEFYVGENEQSVKVQKFHTGHLDVSYEWSKGFTTVARYDRFDPNLKVAKDLEQKASLALVFSNRTRSSNLILVGSKVIEEGANIPNDEIRLVWSLSPSGVVRF